MLWIANARVKNTKNLIFSFFVPAKSSKLSLTLLNHEAEPSYAYMCYACKKRDIPSLFLSRNILWAIYYLFIIDDIITEI